MNVEQRVAIRFCQKAGFNATKNEMLKKAYDDILKRIAMFEWFSRFHDGYKSPYVDERTRLPSSIQINENIERVIAEIKNSYSMANNKRAIVLNRRKMQRFTNRDFAFLHENALAYFNTC